MSNGFDRFWNPAEQAGNYRIAEPVKRFWANVIDGLFLGALVLVAAILSAIFGALFGVMGLGIIGGFFAVIFLLAAPIGYLVVQIRFWSKSTSFGKNILKMKVVSKDKQENMSFAMMLAREIIGKNITSMFFGIGNLWIILDPDCQSWQDKFVRSIVVIAE